MRVKVWAARLAPPVVAAVAGVLALGPALGPGFALRYDMVFVPNPPLTAVTLGAGDGFPRAVPSDAAVAALSALLPAGVVQSLVLLAIFVLGGTGASRLVPGTLLLPRLAAAVFSVWNPFVAERLLLGQWAMLLGYAGLPWVLAAAAGATRASEVRTAGWPGRPRRTGGVHGFARLVTALVPAAVGGFSSVALSALVALPAAALRRGPGMRAVVRDVRARVGSAATAVAALLLVSLPWLIPALGSGASTDPAAVDLFAARADGPVGAVGSLLVLGGVWNAQAVPEWYGVPALAACRLVLAVAAVAGWVWLLRGGARTGKGRKEQGPQSAGTPLARARRAPEFGAGLSTAAGVGLAVALVGVSEPGRELLRTLIGIWPGFGPLRDGQLYVAPLALLQAIGFGGAVAWVLHSAGIGDRAAVGGHGKVGAPGEPLISSEADSNPTPPIRFPRLWKTRTAPLSATPTAVPPPKPTSTSTPAPTPAPSSTSTSTSTSTPKPAPTPAPPHPARHDSHPTPRRAERALGSVVAVLLVLAPLVLLPGLAWAAGGKLAPVRYPAEWTEVQRKVASDPRPGAVLSLPWSAYRGLDWTADGRTVVVLDPATKLFGRRVAWNDDLRVAVDGEVRVIEGEDPLARAVDPLLASGWPMRPAPGTARRLADEGVRYVLIDREAARRAPAPSRSASGLPADTAALPSDENTFSIYPDGAEIVHEGPRMTLIMLPDRHVRASIDRLTGLEVTGWFVTVVAILWSMFVSGSNLVPVRPARSTGMGTRKENRK